MNDLDLAAIVNQEAGGYARRCSWMRLDDLQQEGWRAGLEARAQHAAPAWVRTCISRQLYRYCWRESSPVHLNFNRLPESGIALRFCPRPSPEDGEAPDPFEMLGDPGESPEDQAHRQLWREAFHARVAAIAREELFPPHRRAAVRCVLGLSTPEREGRRTGYAPPTVKKAANRLRALARLDPHLRSLRLAI